MNSWIYYLPHEVQFYYTHISLHCGLCLFRLLAQNHLKLNLKFPYMGKTIPAFSNKYFPLCRHVETSSFLALSHFPTAITLHTNDVSSLALPQMKDLLKVYSSVYDTTILVSKISTPSKLEKKSYYMLLPILWVVGTTRCSK